MLYDLIYFSHAVNTMHAKNMKPLLLQSRQRNSNLGITGMLVYVEGILNNHKEGRFLQILEGPELEVKKVYTSIKNDFRHNHVTILKEGPIVFRNFSAWKMCYKSFDLLEHPDLQFFFQMDLHYLIYNADDHPMLDFLKSYSSESEM